ncbi:V-type proton ATPase 116 kDa subunit a1-like isoform X2 [Watersipora subatra]|uniref:V-type proton ATPase 116 kDa subunit a1-like isoform X2 n=1 Tax=Watersipora subatra TaxID=2589382 RepID=UPI00355B6BD6
MGNGRSQCSSNEEHNSLFRSEEMTLCQLFLQSEAAYSVIAELGELGLLQFKDLNPELSAFQRKFVTEVRQCEEMDRILRFLESEIAKEKIKPATLTEIPAAPLPKEIRDIQNELNKLERDLKDVNTNRQQLKTNFLELMEMQAVLNASASFLEETAFQGASAATNKGYARDDTDDIELGDKAAPPHGGADGSMRLNFITGTIPAERLNGFERMLWFACRGNVYLRHSEITEEFEDPVTGDPIRKTAFCLFFQGDKLKQKATKICEGFHCNTYSIPKTVEERNHMSEGLAQRIKDINVVFEKTDDHRKRLLMNSAQDTRALSVKVLKTKAIYHTLNMFNMDVTHKCLIAEVWAPVRDMDRINEAITEGTNKSNSEIPSVINRMVANETIPTFNRTNRFTKAFQSIVDAYGIGRYQEVNPALFSIITFPFIFAIMFGDFAHGIIMFAFALWMVLSEKRFLRNKGSNEIWNMIFGGRYIIFFMGLFSIYTGFVYNDFFSKSVNLFGSAWTVPMHGNDTEIDPHHASPITRLQREDRVHDIYPIGIDPIWMISINKITFINSYKMKMSIVIGIIQMLFGLMLSLVNHIFFRNVANIFCEFIPELIFILSIFGYMLLLIIVKWLQFFHNTNCAPSILVGFINMFLFSYNTNSPCKEYILFNHYDDMKFVQTILVGAAGICMPWLLITKPLVIGIQRAIHKSKSTGNADITPVNDNENAEASADKSEAAKTVEIVEKTEEAAQQANPEGDVTVLQGNGHSIQVEPDGGEEEEEESGEDGMGEVIVHQCIHTIEYCLGCVSNTASYLRLWALSLAHAQLSEVLWNMVLKIGFTLNANYLGAAGLIITFTPFAVLTVAVLLMMEGLSAFLHALRLHWVEFNSKFFYGDGIKFTPFNFKQAIMPRKAENE